MTGIQKFNTAPSSFPSSSCFLIPSSFSVMVFAFSIRSSNIFWGMHTTPDPSNAIIAPGLTAAPFMVIVVSTFPFEAGPLHLRQNPCVDGGCMFFEFGNVSNWPINNNCCRSSYFRRIGHKFSNYCTAGTPNRLCNEYISLAKGADCHTNCPPVPAGVSHIIAVPQTSIADNPVLWRNPKTPSDSLHHWGCKLKHPLESCPWNYGKLACNKIKAAWLNYSKKDKKRLTWHFVSLYE